MSHKNVDISVLMSSKLFGVFALALLVVAVELGIGEANSWFFLGLNILVNNDDMLLIPIIYLCVINI